MIWYLASRACTNRFCKLASRVRIAVYCFASSVQIRSRANFCTWLVGNTSQTQRSHKCGCASFDASCKKHLA
jgi:hypothetical protein